MPDRLYIVVETTHAYTRWCLSRQLSPDDPRLVPLYPRDHQEKIQGAECGCLFVLVWEPGRANRSRPIRGRLKGRGAVQLVGVEIDAWLRGDGGERIVIRDSRITNRAR